MGGRKLELETQFDDKMEKREKKHKKKSRSEEAPTGEVEEVIKMEKKEKKEKKKKEKKRSLEESEFNPSSVNGSEEKKKRKIEENKERGEEEEDSKIVTVSGENTTDQKYTPLTSFEHSNLPENVLQCCQNFKKPSPIQSHAWPFLLNGRDFIGIAATGSGKDFVFLVHFLKINEN